MISTQPLLLGKTIGFQVKQISPLVKHSVSDLAIIRFSYTIETLDQTVYIFILLSLSLQPVILHLNNQQFCRSDALLNCDWYTIIQQYSHLRELHLLILVGLASVMYACVLCDFERAWLIV